MTTRTLALPRPRRAARRRAPTRLARQLATGVLVMVLYVGAAMVAYAHAWAHPTSVTVGAGLGDPAQTMWFLRFVPHALAHGHNPFFTTVGNVPLGVNVLAQTSVLALGLLLAPVTVVWGPLVSWNVAITLAFALSAGAGYLLCRRFVSWAPAAFVGGLLYGFSPYMVGQGVGHLNLVFVPLPALIFLALHEIAVDQRGSPLRWGVFLAALVVVQFFVSTEVLATTAMFAVLALVVVAFVRRPRALRLRVGHAVEALAVAVVLAGAALAYPLHVVLAGPQHIHGPIAGFLNYYGVASGPLLPTSLMLVGTGHLKRLGDEIVAGNLVENGTYLGVPLLLCFAVVVAVVRSTAVRVLALLAALAFVLSLGASFHGTPSDVAVGPSLPARWINQVPLLNQAYPIRYSLYVAVFVAVVLAIGLDTLHWRLAGRRQALHVDHRRHGRFGPFVPVGVPALVAAFVLFPLIPAWPYAGQRPVEVPAYFTSPAVEAVPAGSVALVYPIGSATDTRAQLWQAMAGLRFKMPGGYFLVPGAGQPATATASLTADVLGAVSGGRPPARTPELRQQLRAELSSWGVGSILAYPTGSDPVGFFTWLTGRAPDENVGGIFAWYDLSWS